MNAIVYVLLTSGKVNVYRSQTLDGAVKQMLSSMDDVCADTGCIAEISLYTRFQVNPADSKVFGLLEARNLSDKLK